MSSIDHKISQAKAKLLVDYPYFGTLASKLELVVNDDIEAFKSNGVKLEYNSDYLQALKLSEMEFVFANGAMHASLAHEQRKNNRSGWLWQMATDYAINDMLVENGLDLPDRVLYRVRFKGLYAEEIYAELKEMNLDNFTEFSEVSELNEVEDLSSESNSNQKFQEQIQQEVNSESSTESSQGSKLNRLEESSLCSTSDQDLEEQLFGEFAKTTLESEFKKGEAPKTIERFFNLTCQGKIDWRDELKVAIDRFHKDDYVLIPPNKKFLYVGIYLPSCVSQRFKLVVAVDSSGSVDEELLNTFFSELNFLMNTIANYQIDLLVCDDKIQSHKTFYSGDILEADLKGGGATDFRPVFEFIEDTLQDTKLLLYFSDLAGKFPHVNPSYDVKWVVPRELEVPFGEVIVL
ncbi:MAG: VWA-like domain-containing protein [Sulfurimonas sp.]|nr:VWA-like domain-containing protein [Sulfurimonas sp.]